MAPRYHSSRLQIISPCDADRRRRFIPTDKLCPRLLRCPGERLLSRTAAQHCGGGTKVSSRHLSTCARQLVPPPRLSRRQLHQSVDRPALVIVLLD